MDAPRGLGNVAQLLGGQHVVRPAVLPAIGFLLFQPGNADLEKLIEHRLEMHRNRSRSSSGTVSSLAWARTRRWNSSIDSSRLM